MASDGEPNVPVSADDPWTLMYTSGTTGKPKGAIRSHRGSAMLSLVTEVEMGLRRRDSALLVMPMCHANSLYFFGAFTYCGARLLGLQPEELRSRASGAHARRRRRDLHLAGADPLHHDAGPARRRARSAQCRRGDEADDLVGAGAARHQARDHGVFQELRPLRALRLDRSRLGHDAAARRAVHQARLGRTRMHRLAADPAARSRTATTCPTARPASSIPATPTRSTATGNCRRRPRKRSAATIARSATSPAATRTATIYLVDRKSNMIISGGENVYPSEVEDRARRASAR